MADRHRAPDAPARSEISRTGTMRSWMRSTRRSRSSPTAARALGDRTWGEANSAEIRHPLAARFRSSDRYLNMPGDPLPGDVYTPRASTPRTGPSERMAVSPGRESEGILHIPDRPERPSAVAALRRSVSRVAQRRADAVPAGTSRQHAHAHATPMTNDINRRDFLKIERRRRRIARTCTRQPMHPLAPRRTLRANFAWSASAWSALAFKAAVASRKLPEDSRMPDHRRLRRPRRAHVLGAEDDHGGGAPGAGGLRAGSARLRALVRNRRSRSGVHGDAVGVARAR